MINILINLSITKHASFNACSHGGVSIGKMLSTHGMYGIISIHTYFHLLTCWFIHWRDSNRTAAVNSHIISTNFDQRPSIHPVLNEANDLFTIEVVCAKKHTAVGHSVRWIFITDENGPFKKISDWKMALALTLNCFNDSLLDETTVMLRFIRILLLSIQDWSIFRPSILEFNLLHCTILDRYLHSLTSTEIVHQLL